MNAQLDARLLAIGIDATTRTAGHKRRKQRHGSALTVAIAIAALAAAYFGLRMIPAPLASNTANIPVAVAGGVLLQQGGSHD